MPSAGRLTQTPLHGARKRRGTTKSDSGVFTFRSRSCYCAKIIAALVEAFLLVASCFDLPAARDPGHVRLRQARHLADAAGAAGAVVAEAADRKRSAFFLFGRAPHPPVLHQPEARPADGILVVRLPEVGLAQLRP